MEFKHLKLIDPILKAIEEKGYENPTKIQGEAIPKILKRKDVLGIAQTGTGKTAAFAIPIIQLIYRIDVRKGETSSLRALIVTPTRELAIQIDENIRDYNKYTGLTHTVIFGGVKQGAQVTELKKGVQILVATPGRLLDLINQGFISLDDIKIFVLDEADRMLDMGFIHDIRKLIAILPKKRQTLFFSATMPDNIIDLSKKMLTEPERVEVARKSSVVQTISQYVYYTNKPEKTKLLGHILRDIKEEQVLVFARTKHGADRLVRNLKRFKLKAEAIHGNKSQNRRQQTLKNFKAEKTKILVATDIAARGIDISGLKYVINYDVPNVPETYVHRIGRSGRAGEEGIAISISEPEENAYIKDIEKLTKNKLTRINDHPYPQTDRPMTATEKKEWNKEKQRKKQEFLQRRRKR
ncbi:MAG: DEAD/DEAH box helicase [Saprospiraceae bacterium]|nr:DEAD/DEAH box helicase [Saprospiraceae bacterium]